MADVFTNTRNLKPGETSKTTVEYKDKTLPYSCFVESGRNNMSRFPVFENFHKTVGSLSKAASWVFWLIVENRDYRTNLSEYIPETAKDKAQAVRAYKELRKVELLVRAKRGVYMINPTAVLPEWDRMEEIYTKWCDLLKTK